MPLRPRLAEGRDAGHDQSRVETAEILPAQVPALQCPRPKVLGHHIDARHQLADDVLPFGVMQVEGHDPLVAILHRPPVADIFLRRPHAPHIVAAPGHLDLDHLGAELGHQRAAEWPGDDLRQLQDPNAV
jgi:hypothetical protein